MATMKRFKITFLVFIFLASVGYAPSAQREQGTTNITGRVSSALQLSVRKGLQPLSNQSAGDLYIAAGSVGVDSVQIILSGSGQTAASQIVLPLEIRTNEGYELKLALLSSEGPAPALLASIGSVRPTGALVAPRATDVSRGENSIDLTRCLNPVTTLRGTRISMGGNFTTPANALLADLNIAISPGGGTPGYWRVLFRISLHRSA